MQETVQHLERACRIADFDRVRELVRGNRTDFTEVRGDVVAIERGTVSVCRVEHLDERTDTARVLAEVVGDEPQRVGAKLQVLGGDCLRQHLAGVLTLGRTFVRAGFLEPPGE